MLFNGDYWAAWTDLAFAIVTLVGNALSSNQHDDDTTMKEAAATIKGQLSAFYLGTTTWKINTSFLSPRTSCASILFVQLLHAYYPFSSNGVVPTSLTRWVVVAAPWITLIVEGSVGVWLALPRYYKLLGLGLGLLLHFLIALTPPPNNAGGFSVLLATRYFLWIPQDATEALEDPQVLAMATSLAILMAGVLYGGEASSMYGEGSQVHTHYLDVCIPFYTFQTVILGRAILLAARRMESTESDDPATKPVAPRMKDVRLRLLRRCFIGLAYLYSFGFLLLGIQDMQNVHMYANLRVHGRSNHLFLPTGLLFRWFENTTSTWFPFGGGIVRVDSTNSSFVQFLYPHEVTHVLSDPVQKQLREAGHVAREFFPLKARVFGGRALPGAPEQANVRYTVPALELRRLIGEARDHAAREGVGFSLHYARLSSRNVDSETSLTHPPWRRVRLLVDRNGDIVECKSSTAHHHDDNDDDEYENACAEDELAYLPPLSAYVRKVCLYYPIPLPTGEDLSPEMVCADS